MKNLTAKIELYLMSLGLLFFLLIIKSIDIPICFDKDAQFVGFEYLFKHNVATLICLLFFNYFVCMQEKICAQFKGSCGH